MGDVAAPVPTLWAEHAEWVDPFRSGLARVEDAAP